MWARWGHKKGSEPLRRDGPCLRSDFSEELLRGGDGVELAAVDLLHELGVLAAQAPLHLLLQAVLGPGDNNPFERGPPPLSDPAALLQVGAVPLYGRLELLDALARVAAGHDDRGEPRLGVELLPDIEYGADLVGS